LKPQESRMNWEDTGVYKYEKTIPLKIPGYELLYELTDRLLDSVIGEQAELLVVGAGGGKEIAKLGGRHAGWSFHGIDPSARMLEIAEQRVKLASLDERVTLQKGTVELLPQDCRVDAATCLLVLHFVQGRSSKLDLLQQISARLKPGAPVFLACITGELGTHGCTVQLQAWKKSMLAGGIPLEEWEQFHTSLGKESDPAPESDIEALLAEAGFIQATRYFGAFLIHGWMAFKA
jgi:tRNA (cmo5U34)-methyltransferase